jgi:hypothetical protein
MIIISQTSNSRYILNATVYNLMSIKSSDTITLNQTVSILAGTGYGTADLAINDIVTIQNDMPILKAVIIK